MSRYRKIYLDKPSQDQVLEFKRLTGALPLFEDVFDKKEAEELDISDEQWDPDDQISPDDESARAEKENRLRKVTDWDGKEVWSGDKPGKKSKKAKK